MPKRSDMPLVRTARRHRPPSWDLGPEEQDINRLNPVLEKLRLEIIHKHKAQAAHWPEQLDDELELMEDLLLQIRTVANCSMVCFGMRM